MVVFLFTSDGSAGLIFFHFQKLSAERAGLAELDIVQKEWMAIVPYLLSLEFEKVCAVQFPIVKASAET